MAALLAASAKAADVTFFSGRDCNPDDQIGRILEVPDESGNTDSENFNDVKPVSMLVIGWATVLLGEETNNHFDQKTCAYCADYHTQSGDCFADDRQKCVNIETGYGPGHAELIAIGSPSPADLPCRNYQDRCPFPTPPGNGFCAQS